MQHCSHASASTCAAPLQFPPRSRHSSYYRNTSSTPLSTIRTTYDSLRVITATASRHSLSWTPMTSIAPSDLSQTGGPAIWCSSMLYKGFGVIWKPIDTEDRSGLFGFGVSGKSSSPLSCSILFPSYPSVFRCCIHVPWSYGHLHQRSCRRLALFTSCSFAFHFFYPYPSLFMFLVHFFLFLTCHMILSLVISLSSSSPVTCCGLGILNSDHVLFCRQANLGVLPPSQFQSESPQGSGVVFCYFTFCLRLLRAVGSRKRPDRLVEATGLVRS